MEPYIRIRHNSYSLIYKCQSSPFEYNYGNVWTGLEIVTSPCLPPPTHPKHTEKALRSGSPPPSLPTIPLPICLLSLSAIAKTHLDPFCFRRSLLGLGWGGLAPSDLRSRVSAPVTWTPPHVGRFRYVVRKRIFCWEPVGICSISFDGLSGSLCCFPASVLCVPGFILLLTVFWISLGSSSRLVFLILLPIWELNRSFHIKIALFAFPFFSCRWFKFRGARIRGSLPLRCQSRLRDVLDLLRTSPRILPCAWSRKLSHILSLSSYRRSQTVREISLIHMKSIRISITYFLFLYATEKFVFDEQLKMFDPCRFFFLHDWILKYSIIDILSFHFSLLLFGRKEMLEL